MREFLKCSKCAFISADEKLLTVPAFAAMIKPEWVCKCTPDALHLLLESKKDFYDLQGQETLNP